MKHALPILIAFCFLSTIRSGAQTIGGYSFEKYRAEEVHVTRKAPIDYRSNRVARTFKTVLTDGYRKGEVDFGGHYVTVRWGCGTYCQWGAMVDVRDGKVYTLPLGEDVMYADCGLDEAVTYKKYSRLFVTTECKERDVPNTRKVREDRIHFINVWSERKKTFELVDKVKKSVILDR